MEDRNDSIHRVMPGNRLSRAVVHNGTIYFSGIISDNLSSDFSEQMNNILQKIDITLKELKSDKSRILSVTIYLTDISRDYDLMNKIWDAWIVPDQLPARATMEVRLAKEEYKLEIMLIAAC